MTNDNLSQGSRIMVALAQRHLEQLLNREAPFLAMLSENDEPLPEEIADLLSTVANAYYRTAGSIRRRQGAAARPEAHSRFLQTACTVGARL